MNTPTIQAKDLIKTDNIYKAHASDSLSSALKSLTHSHDAAFVFDDDDKFIGVINPYYAVYQNNFPPETKLENAVHKPPVLSPDTYIWDIAKLMRESKVYYLPVIEKNEFIGIISINRLLQAIRSMKTMKNLPVAMKKKIITVDHDATLEEAYTTMRDQQVSRLPVVNPHGHLVGLITRYDIQKVLATPKERPQFARIGEKTGFLDRPIHAYYQKVVVQGQTDTPVEKIIEEMFTRTVGSMVIVDSNRKPVGIVSTHDILAAIAALSPKPKNGLSLQVSPDFIHEVQLVEMLADFEQKLRKSYNVDRIHTTLKTDKNAAGKVSRYQVTLQVEFKSGKQKVIARTEGHAWRLVVKDALSKVKAQLFD